MGAIHELVQLSSTPGAAAVYRRDKGKNQKVDRVTPMICINYPTASVLKSASILCSSPFNFSFLSSLFPFFFVILLKSWLSWNLWLIHSLFSSSISVAPTHRTSLTLPATRLSSVNNGNQVRWKFHGISNKTVRPKFLWRGKAQTQINEWLITDDEKETSFSTHYPKFDQPEGSPPDQSHRFFQLFYQSHVAYLQHLLQQSTMARSEILSQL